MARGSGQHILTPNGALERSTFAPQNLTNGFTIENVARSFKASMRLVARTVSSVKKTDGVEFCDTL